MTPAAHATVHASCVAVNGRGLLILGPSGAGKSALALHLMAFGASLVADDQTEIWTDGHQLYARSPLAIHGLIEARGVGILHAPALPQAEICLCVDLGQTETDRLPPLRYVSLLGHTLRLVLGPLAQRPGDPHFPAAILCYLKAPQSA